MRLLLLLIFFVASLNDSLAATEDSFFLRVVRGGWEIWHRSKPGETLADLSKMYGSNAALIAAVNHLDSNERTAVYGAVAIPVPPELITSDTLLPGSVAKPLYYRVLVGDRLSDLCRLSAVSPERLMSWNGGGVGESPGRVLILGWLRMPVQVVTKVEELTSSMQQQWQDQTLNGKNVIVEKGSAGFYNLTTQTSEAAYYAFHNVAPKGTVMKIRNLNNGRTIFVRIIGPLPEGKQFYGCDLGLSDFVKQALDARENKIFCEISYAGY